MIKEKIVCQMNTQEKRTNIKLLHESVALKSHMKPKGMQLTLRMIEHHHTKKIHGRVGDTMGCVREKFSIPNLRVAVKKVICGINFRRRY